MKACHACKKELTLGREIGRRDECPHCHADLHCCMNCRFHDRSAPKQCREPIAELVKEKDRANFCDLFSFTDQMSGAALAQDHQAASRKALDDLFKK